MGQSCTKGKPKSNVKKEHQDKDASTDKTKKNAGPSGSTQDKENNQVIDFLFDVSKPSFYNNTEVRKNKKIQIDQDSNNNMSCFITNENIKNVYQITDNVLGKGTFGTVKEAHLFANPQKKFAVKCISKDSGGESKNFDWLYREVSIFRQLDHPNVAKLYECYQDEKNFYLVMENCNGGQLLQKVVAEKRFSEQFASQIIAQMFSTVKYLHELGIVHRDLKPENFLFTSDVQEIKMIDFGLSKQYSNSLDLMKHQINENYLRQEVSRNSMFTPPSNSSAQSARQIQTIVGTVQYIAPEVLTGKYDYRCDIWSLGVILYCILYGEFPFTGRNDNEIFDQIRRGNYQFKDEIKLSKQVKELISKMICVDPKKRIDMASALKHQWFKLQNTHQYDQGRILQIKHINNIKNYPIKISPFQRLMIHYYYKIFSNQTLIKDFTRAFRAIDQNNEGIINVQTLQKAMTGLGYKENLEEITNIINKISSVCYLKANKYNTCKMDEYIEYSLFLECNIDRNVLNQDDVQQKLFMYIDSSKKGYITKDDIINCLKREGLLCSEEYIKELTQEFQQNLSSTNQNNVLEEEDEYKIKIQFNEFQRVLNPAPPTQNNSFIEHITIDQQGTSKNQNQNNQINSQNKGSWNALK